MLDLVFLTQTFEGASSSNDTTVDTENFILQLRERYGNEVRVGRGNVFRFGNKFVFAIGNSKELPGKRYFFAVQEDFLRAQFGKNTLPSLQLHAVFVCGNIGAFVIPHSLLAKLLPDYTKNRVTILQIHNKFYLRATGQTAVEITRYLNVYPEVSPQLELAVAEEKVEIESPEQQVSEINEHTRIQWMLIRFGLLAGHKVWLPANDRIKNFAGEEFSELTLTELPNFGFDSSTRQVISNIDVLWLGGNVIHKAFEIESTTSVYSGLLRMSDLILSQPNISIDLHIVAPLRRRDVVRKNICALRFRICAPNVLTFRLRKSLASSKW